MANINDIVINISMNTKPLSVKGFGLPLILGKGSGNLVGVYGEYSEPEELIGAGFELEDDEYKLASAMFAQSPRPGKIAIYRRSSTTAIDKALADLVQTNNDWYVLHITEKDKDSLHSAGDFALINRKMFFGCSDDLSVLNDRNNNREAYMIQNVGGFSYDAAWVGEGLPHPIGSITWKYRTPTGVLPSMFSTTELNEIRSKNGQTFTEQSGIIYSNEGITTGGEYIDNMMSCDFVHARLEEALFSLKIKSGKVSMDDEGLEMIESAMRGVFKLCGKQKIIAAVGSEADMEKSDEGKYMYQIWVPLRSEIPANDRAERKATGIRFKFTVAGAVHSTEINGIIEI